MGASGISKDTASKFFELIGLEVGGWPGRPTKDYSWEYELKARLVGKSASKLTENAELREEFGGRDFDSLSFEERETSSTEFAKVKSYAARTGCHSPSTCRPRWACRK